MRIGGKGYCSPPHLIEQLESPYCLHLNELHGLFCLFMVIAIVIYG